MTNSNTVVTETENGTRNFMQNISFSDTEDNSKTAYDFIEFL
jgi:hypothetical protein